VVEVEWRHLFCWSSVRPEPERDWICSHTVGKSAISLPKSRPDWLIDDAVYRFAQIVHASKAPAIPVLFMWPSLGELRAYTYDRESTNFSRDALEELLDMLSRQPRGTEVNVLAHSMGNWITLEALRGRSICASRSAYDPTSDKLKNVLMASW
jgi:esterase/lipase superfamily enzyme